MGERGRESGRERESSAELKRCRVGHTELHFQCLLSLLLTRPAIQNVFTPLPTPVDLALINKAIKEY